MKKIALTLALALPLALFGQDTIIRSFNATVTFQSFVLTSSGRYSGTLSVNDQTNTYRGDSVKVGDYVFSPSATLYVIDTVSSANRFSAAVVIRRLSGRNVAPTGVGDVFRPTKNYKFPTFTADNQNGIPTQAQFIKLSGLVNRIDSLVYVVASASGGVTDGDKVDIIVSGGGAVYTIDSAAVTGAKTNFSGRSGDATKLLGAQSNGTTDTVKVGSGLTLSGGVLSATGGGGGGSSNIDTIYNGYGIVTNPSPMVSSDTIRADTSVLATKSFVNNGLSSKLDSIAGEVTTFNIRDTAITTGKIATGAVTGAKLGSITSTEIRTALSDETGTGSAVFANNPVFTDINLNGTVGNATGNITLTNNSTPEWGIGAAGSGSTSDLIITNWLDANKRPLFIKQGNNYVGINTGAPLSQLHIVGKVRIDTLNSTPGALIGLGTDSTIVRLDPATYPTITELSYVKGVTSALQTQLSNKLDSLAGEVTTFVIRDTSVTWPKLAQAVKDSINRPTTNATYWSTNGTDLTLSMTDSIINLAKVHGFVIRAQSGATSNVIANFNYPGDDDLGKIMAVTAEDESASYSVQLSGIRIGAVDSSFFNLVDDQSVVFSAQKASDGNRWVLVSNTVGSGGGGGGGVTSITAGTGLTGGTIVTSGTIAADTNFLVTVNDTAAMLTNYINVVDTATMLSTYINAADTASMLTNYINVSDTAAMLLTYINAADTAAILSTYINAADTAAMLTNYINVSDTSAMLNPYLKRTVDSIMFKTTYTATATTGEMIWNDQSGTVHLGMTGNIEMPLGQAEAHMVRNTTGSQISKGKVVYINGATGQRPTIALADADSEGASSGTFGVTAEAIDNNDTGFVFISGYIKGINTNTIAPGSALWLDTVPGNFTTTKRVAPVHTVLVGYAVTQATNGTIFVKIANGQELGELHDVDVTSPVNGSLLRYNSTSAIWLDAQADSASIAADAIKNIHITNSAVNTSKLADSTVTALKIATATIANANIANATITAAKLVDSTITGVKIASSTIGTANIANSSVTGAKLGTMSSTELRTALSNETGSGAAVFADSAAMSALEINNFSGPGSLRLISRGAGITNVTGTIKFMRGDSTFWDINTDNNNNLFFAKNNLDQPFRINQSNGFIGIQNINPGTALDVNGVITATNQKPLILRRDASANDSSIDQVFTLKNSSGTYTDYAGIAGRIVRNNAGTTAGALDLLTADSAQFGIPAIRATIDQYGRFGIGTTLPSRTLHVNGTARITNLVTENPTLLVGANSAGDLNKVVLGTGLTLSNDTLNASGGGSLTDGDKTDITVSNSGATWTIDSAAVTGAKTNFAGRAGDATRLLGAQSNGTTDTVQVGTGLTLSGGVLSATGGGGGGSGVITGVVAGEVAYGIGADSLGGESALFYSAANDRLSVGGETSPTATLQVKGAGTTTGETVLVENSAGADRFAILDNGQINLYNTAVTNNQTNGVAYFANQTTNGGIVIRPNGSGSVMLNLPDNTATGGDERGTYSVDLNLIRNNRNEVASGNFSGLFAGQNLRAASQRSVVLGGNNNLISATGATNSFIVGGSGNTLATNTSSAGIIAGTNCTVTGNDNQLVIGNANTGNGFAGFTSGNGAYGYLYGSTTRTSSRIATLGDAQQQMFNFMRAVTGVDTTEIFLENSNIIRAILQSGSPSTTNRLWNANIQLTAIVSVQGNGSVDSVAVGKSFIGNYSVGIKRIGSATSLVGTVQNLHTPQFDTGMSTTKIIIDANDTNEALRLRFQAPTGAGSTTVIRVVATVYLTEVGY